MTKFKDTDYLHASARIRVLEKYMLTGEGLRKMAEARTLDEAWKLANDAGIGVSSGVKDYEAALQSSLAEAYTLAEELLGESGLIRLFRLRYDAHNLKTLVKATRAGNRDELLSELGNVPPDVLKAEFAEGSFASLEPSLAEAAQEASELLAKNRDPQMTDIIIDKAALEALAQGAQKYKSEFLAEIVGTQIDIANIRALVRIKRMGRDGSLVRAASARGGFFSPEELAEILPRGWDEIFEMLKKAPCSKYIEPAFEQVKNGKTLSPFEKLCDNAGMAVLIQARYIPFGMEPVLAWLLAKENEIQAARIVLACKAEGVASADIIERLRDSYAQ